MLRTKCCLSFNATVRLKYNRNGQVTHGNKPLLMVDAEVSVQTLVELLSAEIR